MNDYYESMFFQVLVMKVLCIVTENTGSGCDRFGEGRKPVGHVCQEFLFALVKCLRFGEVHSPCRLQKQNYQDNRTQCLKPQDWEDSSREGTVRRGMCMAIC